MKNLMVVVLYKKRVEESQTLQYLLAHTAWKSAFDLLLVNNDPSITIPESPDYQIYNAPENLFLNKAYNYAYEQALQNGAQWLMLLDQDTFLSEDFEQSVLQALDQDAQAATSSSVTNTQHIDLLFPRVYGKTVSGADIFLSPGTYHPQWGFNLGSHRLQQPGYAGHHCFKAINSGTVVRVSTLQKINGFPVDYPMDCLDFRFLYLLYLQGATAQVLPCAIYQNLSILDLSSMSHERYNKMLYYELRFFTQVGKWPLFLWRINLIKRAFRRFRNTSDKQFAQITWSYLTKTI